jgi:hypothetical protein
LREQEPAPDIVLVTIEPPRAGSTPGYAPLPPFTGDLPALFGFASAPQGTDGMVRRECTATWGRSLGGRLFSGYEQTPGLRRGLDAQPLDYVGRATLIGCARLVSPAQSLIGLHQVVTAFLAALVEPIIC